MHLTPENQATILAGLKTKTLLAVPVVFDTLYYFGGKEDFAATANIANSGTPYDKDTEAQFAIVYLKGFTDAVNQGTCDDPSAILEYRILVFYEYKAVRKGVTPTNSRQDFVAALVNLRSEFNFNQVLIEAVAEHESLTIAESIQNGAESRYLKGVKGDFIEFSVMVEVQ